MNANIKARTKFGESRSMNHSISQIQIIVRIKSKMWATQNVSIVFVQFHKRAFSFIFYWMMNKKYDVINSFLLYFYN
jgi:hypothetical protein